jgi:valyl-tRNA synthetase
MEQHGKISLQTSSGIVELGPESVEIEKEVISAGRAVDVLDVRGIPVVIIR